MSEGTREKCPHCGREVASNRPYAVMRCGGCAALLQLENGKIVRSAPAGTSPLKRPNTSPEMKAVRPPEEPASSGGVKITPPLPVPRPVAPLRAKPLATPAPELIRPARDAASLPVEPKAESRLEPAVEASAEARPEPRVEPRLEARTEPASRPPPEAMPEAGAETITAEEDEVVQVELPPTPARSNGTNGASRRGLSEDEVAAGSRPPRAQSRRPLQLALGIGGALIVVVSVLVILLSRRSDEPAPAPAPGGAEAPAVGGRTAPTPPPGPPPPTAVEPDPAEAPALAVAPPSPTEVASGEPASPRPRKMLGGKPVVLEYDKPPAKLTPAPQGVDAQTVARARDAYQRGNRRLYAGDADGAIVLYRESLRIYPGYVAGYRGLGLAFAQKGDSASAIAQMRTYVRAVPTAKDVPLVKQRIERLERQNTNR